MFPFLQLPVIVVVLWTVVLRVFFAVQNYNVVFCGRKFKLFD